MSPWSCTCGAITPWNTRRSNARSLCSIVALASSSATVATLAAHYAKALVPTLFTHPGKQPLEVVPAQKHLTISDGGPVPLPFLKRLAEGRAEGGRYVQNWARDFDYLYLVGPPVANPMPDILDEVMHARRFTLYRIRRGISSGG